MPLVGLVAGSEQRTGLSAFVHRLHCIAFLRLWDLQQKLSQVVVVIEGLVLR